MKPNVDIVNLIAIQELATVVSPTTADYFNIGKATDLLGKKISISDTAQLISSELGSGSILPERRYLIDTDMPSGSSYVVNGDGNGQINDPYLDGKVFDVHRNGLLIAKGFAWQNDVVGGGIRLLVPFDTFELGEEIVISFQPAFSPYIPTQDAIARFSNGEQIITAETSTITGAMFRKIIRLRSATDRQTLTLPAASAYPANVILCIVADGGTQKQTTLKCAGSDNIVYNNANWPEFWIRQCEQILLIPAATADKWIVINYSGSDHFSRLGVTDMGCLQGPNHWNAATNPGPQERAVYPGTWNFILRLKAAQPAAVVSGAAWISNPTMWGEGDGSTTFNFPYKAGYFPRYLDPTGNLDDDRFAAGKGNLPNSTQEQEFEEHNHITDSRFNRASARASDVDGTGTPGSIDNVNPTTEYRVGYMSGPSYDLWPLAEIKSMGGTETRPVNVGELPLINI